MSSSYPLQCSGGSLVSSTRVYFNEVLSVQSFHLGAGRSYWLRSRMRGFVRKQMRDSLKIEFFIEGNLNKCHVVVSGSIYSGG